MMAEALGVNSFIRHTQNNLVPIKPLAATGAEADGGWFSVQ